ncbi:MAG TPA: hypothetical protein VKU41_23095 [Polyangiaceae bacterium]|nr:hypothetical protein [Polyangiaceae bacterium]
MTPLRRTLGTLATVAVGLSAAVYCACGGGSSSGPGFGETPAGPSQAASDAGSDNRAQPVTAPAPATDAGYANFGAFADVEAGPKVDCLPGTYTGMFNAAATADAGLLALFGTSFAWGGNLSLTLTGTTEVIEAGGGEFRMDYTVLTIAPGAKLSGTDMYGGQFTADVSGQLDCPSRTLTGTLENGTYLLPGLGDAGSIMMLGALTATYDPTANPVALIGGTITASSPQVQSLGANGTWTATRQ